MYPASAARDGPGVLVYSQQLLHQCRLPDAFGGPPRSLQRAPARANRLSPACRQAGAGAQAAHRNAGGAGRRAEQGQQQQRRRRRRQHTPPSGSMLCVRVMVELIAAGGWPSACARSLTAVDRSSMVVSHTCTVDISRKSETLATAAAVEEPLERPTCGGTQQETAEHPCTCVLERQSLPKRTRAVLMASSTLASSGAGAGGPAAAVDASSATMRSVRGAVHDQTARPVMVCLSLGQIREEL